MQKTSSPRASLHTTVNNVRCHNEWFQLYSSDLRLIQCTWRHLIYSFCFQQSLLQWHNQSPAVGLKTIGVPSAASWNSFVVNPVWAEVTREQHVSILRHIQPGHVTIFTLPFFRCCVSVPSAGLDRTQARCCFPSSWSPSCSPSLLPSPLCESLSPHINPAGGRDSERLSALGLAVHPSLKWRWDADLPLYGAGGFLLNS